jgi:hypothetical protein
MKIKELFKDLEPDSTFINYEDEVEGLSLSSMDDLEAESKSDKTNGVVYSLSAERHIKYDEDVDYSYIEKQKIEIYIDRVYVNDEDVTGEISKEEIDFLKKKIKNNYK